MKRIVAYITVLLLATTTIFAQNSARKKSITSWDSYEITTEKVGVEGTKFVKVWGFGKTVDKAVMAAKRNAVFSEGFQVRRMPMQLLPSAKIRTLSKTMRSISRLSLLRVGIT